MKQNPETLRNFAKLIVKEGVNLQKGQVALLNVGVDAIELARLVAEECWLAGASDVLLRLSDEGCLRLRYKHGSLEQLSKVPNWLLEQITDYPPYVACYIHIISDDPDLLAGLDAEKIGKSNAERQKGMKPYRDLINKNENQWCIVAYPSAAWAAKVFPNLPAAEALQKLWDAIVIATRLDLPDPVAAWSAHRKALGHYSKWLTELDLAALEFKSGLGTDLHLDLADGYRFAGGGDVRVDGVAYFPNMPTEEVFSMPHKDRVNGKVVASMPLSYQGNLIENFWLQFKDGEVVDYHAEKGQETLTQMLAADAGAKRLGEVALVPYSSPIRRSGILFYNTLFDENAACHLALGSAYPDTMEGCLAMSEEERAKHGYNDSAMHVDFMFGTADLSVVGVGKDGKRTVIFESGEWVAT